MLFLLWIVPIFEPLCHCLVIQLLKVLRISGYCKSRVNMLTIYGKAHKRKDEFDLPHF